LTVNESSNAAADGDRDWNISEGLMTQPLRVVILKPSKYAADGYVDRFRWGFMPNSTVLHVRSLTAKGIVGDVPPVLFLTPARESDQQGRAFRPRVP
jgi:hypothetical protein